MKISLNNVVLPLTVVEVEYVRKGEVEKTSRLEVRFGNSKIGTLWKKGENLDIDGTVYKVFAGDIYITDQNKKYAKLEVGAQHPYGKVIEVTNKDGLGKHFELEGTFSEGIRTVFYKQDNGTITIHLVVTVPPIK